jgi:hypothetical protein
MQLAIFSLSVMVAPFLFKVFLVVGRTETQMWGRQDFGMNWDE